MAIALPQMLAALDATVTEPVQLVVAGDPAKSSTAELLRVIRKRYLPNKIVLLADGKEGQKWLEQHIEAIGQMTPVGGKSAVYVCRDFSCELPVTDPQELASLLDKRSRS
jgi:hypothetical protein